jgi:hypothetical protein
MDALGKFEAGLLKGNLAEDVINDVEGGSYA